MFLLAVQRRLLGESVVVLMLVDSRFAVDRKVKPQPAQNGVE